MADLNFSDYPERRGQASVNEAPSSYALIKIKSSLAGSYVAKLTVSGWGSPTGTAERTTFASYSAPTVSNPPTQSEVQALADHVQVLSRRLNALVSDLKAAGAI